MKGNTFSENIILFAVLGIFFALTIGVFISDYSKNKTILKLKNVYNQLDKSLNSSVIVNSTPVDWNLPIELKNDTTYLFFQKYIKPYLVISRDCKNSTKGACDYSFKTLNGDENSLDSTWTRFYLKDGSFIAMKINTDYGYKTIYFYIDINGKNQVNVIGKDIFLFEYWIKNERNKEWVGRLLPYGHEFPRDNLLIGSDPNNCNIDSNGKYCSALIVKDGWLITKDYPWAYATRYNVKK